MALPIIKDEFSALMAGLGLGPNDGPFAVAVSGGPDSMALSLLMADYAPTYFLSFDHGLREGSDQEVLQVKDWLKDKGLGHHIVTWEGEKPKTGIQAAARQARYEALEAWCQENGVKSLLTAHHQEDQAETVLMRALKGSGLDGLVGMAPKTGGLSRVGITILRPFLKVPKVRLLQTLAVRGQDFISDPSNENETFTRVRMRNMLEKSDTLNAQILAETAERLGQAKAFLDELTRDFFETALTLSNEGYATIDSSSFQEAPDILANRSLSKVLQFISQSAFPAREEKVRRLCKALRQSDFPGATLLGCRVSPMTAGKILVCREARDVKDLSEIRAGEEQLWDNRFHVSFEGDHNTLTLRPLGEAGWKQVAEQFPKVKEVAIPHPARAGLPAFFEKDRPVLVPHLNFSRDGAMAFVAYHPKNPLFRAF